jgi:hypothetical protein
LLAQYTGNLALSDLQCIGDRRVYWTTLARIVRNALEIR